MNIGAFTSFLGLVASVFIIWNADVTRRPTLWRVLGGILFVANLVCLVANMVVAS